MAEPCKSLVNQFIAAFTVNIISLIHGATLAWISPFLPLLQSQDSPLKSGPVTTEEASWIGSSVSIGGLLGSLISGYIVSRFGKKIGLILLAFPQLGFWSCVIFGQHVHYLYLGRVLAGLTGGGLIIILPLYNADISNKKIRGALGSMFALVSNIGYLTGYTTGHILSYNTVSYVMLPMPILFIICMLFLPETPYCLLKQNKLIEAEKSLMFYRNVRKDAVKNPDFIKEFEGIKKLVQNEKTNKHSSRLTLKDFGEKTARKGLAICLFLMALNQLSGTFAILQYTATIFKESGSELSPNMSTIIVAIIQVFGTIVSFALVDNLGRKILLILSTLGTGLGLAAIATFSFMKESGHDLSNFSWIPIVSLSSAIFLASLGLIPIPYFILPEILPQKILSVGNIICMTTLNLSCFTVLKALPLLIEAIKLYGTMWLFSGICTSGAFVIMLILPETKGKDLLVTERNKNDL